MWLGEVTCARLSPRELGIEVRLHAIGDITATFAAKGPQIPPVDSGSVLPSFDRVTLGSKLIAFGHFRHAVCCYRHRRNWMILVCAPQSVAPGTALALSHHRQIRVICDPCWLLPLPV